MVILLKQANDKFIWLNIDENGNVVDVIHFSQLNQHPVLNPKEFLVVVLPGTAFLSTRVKIPKTSSAELIKAVPFALEDQLVADVSTLYFAIGNFDEQGLLPVIVVDKIFFENELNEIRNAQLNPNVIIPDYLAIKKIASHWSVAINNGFTLLRHRMDGGFTSGSQQFENIFSLFLKKFQNPDAIDIYSSKEDQVKLVFNPVIEHRGDFINSLSIHELQNNPPINLLQAKYRVKTKRFKEKNRWKSVAILFIVLMAVLFGGKIIEYFVLKSQYHSFQKSKARIYREIYPGERQMIEPKLRLTRTVNNLRKAMSGNVFLDILGPTAQALNDNPNIRLISLNYQNNNLIVSLRATELSSLENFSNVLAKKGLIVQQNQLNTTDKIIDAEFQIGKNSNE